MKQDLTGLISLKVLPWQEKDGIYKAVSRDFGFALLYINTEGMDSVLPYLREADRLLDCGLDVYLPCIIGEKVHADLPYYYASPLCRPGLTKSSELFSPGLGIPLLGKDGHGEVLTDPNEIIVVSSHTGLQKYSADRSSNVMPNLLNSGSGKISGVVKSVPVNGGRPVVGMLASPEKTLKSEGQNSEMEQELKRQIGEGVRFYWDLKPPFPMPSPEPRSWYQHF